MKTIFMQVVQQFDNHTEASDEKLSSEASQITIISSSHRCTFDRIDQYYYLMNDSKVWVGMSEGANAPFKTSYPMGCQHPLNIHTPIGKRRIIGSSVQVNARNQLFTNGAWRSQNKTSSTKMF